MYNRYYESTGRLLGIKHPASPFNPRQHDYTIGARRQARLHKAIVLGHVAGIETASKLVVNQILPSNIQSKYIELIVIDEVLHLGSRIVGWVNFAELAVALHIYISIISRYQARWNSDIRNTAKVEPSDIDTTPCNTSSKGIAQAQCYGRASEKL